MSLSPSTKLWGSLGIVVALAVGGLWFVLQAWEKPVASNSTNQSGSSAARERYATLYDAAWRQDQAQGNMLMTATLLLPPTIAALGQDAERSDYDNQVYRAARDVSSNQAAIYITVDSVIGPVPTDTIRQSLTLTSADKRSWRLEDWHSLIRPSVITNSGITLTPQGGVAIFETDQPIDWPNTGQLILASQGIGGIAERRFVWTDTRLLLEVAD